MEATLRLVMTLATTVPTFFIRENPTSSIAKPACMNRTSTAATTTQTVSAPTPAAMVAVLSSSAKAASGTRAAAAAGRDARASRCFMADTVGAAGPPSQVWRLQKYAGFIGSSARIGDAVPPFGSCDSYENDPAGFVHTRRVRGCSRCLAWVPTSIEEGTWP